MNKKTLKLIILIIILGIGLITAIVYGYNNTFKVLLICMLADYLIGFSISLVGKGKHGSIQSMIGYLGIVKKSTMIFIVVVLHSLEPLLKIYNLQEIVTFAFIFNECVSIYEHAKALGLNNEFISSFLKKFLKKKEE